MYFKRLEIVGFKSFMNRTTLDFEPGISAIVGPNGCGKSNIFDAIRWVLGEQSEKALRGSQMVDVIFNGTDKQQALSMAEVTLTFDNEKRFFSVDHGEVAITRRIFRSGENEYLLNKAPVRLKDILELLMGTGIGAESYSIVAQGKIDLILSSRPEDRRVIFDEASGITKYKSQKRETLRRLEETEQNLLRVNDIIIEVRRSIGHLERQANKARKYREVFEDLKNKEIRLALLQRVSIIAQKNQLTEELNLLRQEEETVKQAVSREEESLSRRNEELRSWEEEIEAAKKSIYEFENTIVRNKQHIAFNGQRIKELENNTRYLDEQIHSSRARLAIDEEKLNKLKEERAGVDSAIREKTDLVQQKESELHSLMEIIHSSLELIAQAKKEILELVTRISHVKNDITGFTSKQQIHLARKKRLDIERAKVHEERAEVESNLGNILNELKLIEESLASYNAKITGVKGELELEVSSLQQITSDIDALEKEKLTLESHKAFLQQLKVQYEGIGTSMNAVIYIDKQLPEKLTGLIIKISENAVAEAVPSDVNGSGTGTSFKVNGEAKPVDLDARMVAEKIQGIEEKLVSLSEIKRAKEVLIEELNKNLQEAQGKQKELEMSFGNKQTFHQSTLEQFNKIKEEEEIISLELSDVEKELSEMEQKIQALTGELSLMDTHHKDREAQIHESQEKINHVGGQKEQVLVAIASAKAELEALHKRLLSEDNTLKSLEDACQQDHTAISSFENEIKIVAEKKVVCETEINDLEQKIMNDESAMQEKKTVLIGIQNKFREVSDGIQAVVRAIEEQKKELESRKDMMYKLQMREKDIDFKISSIKERISQSYKVDLDNLPLEFSGGTDGENKVISLLESSGQSIIGRDDPQVPALNENPALVQAVNPQDPSLKANEQWDENFLIQEIERLKGKIESYGTVNLVAIEEYDELKKRYDFLMQQQNDLVTSKASLQSVIQKINRTTKQMFMETFEKVREEFKVYFRLLFNGGDAQLFLVDEQDPLETGIEIICRPPGKKLQNVLLLSGGEKSMAAIALIFAIFKVRPAPFCILDEIDAALDEANVERLGRMLQEFVQYSQFIVITHNKRTIANANLMYGITMQESGVSKIVSVKFSPHPEEKKPEEKKQLEPVS